MGLDRERTAGACKMSLAQSSRKRELAITDFINFAHYVATTGGARACRAEDSIIEFIRWNILWCG